jgi:hypothetical protein
MIYVRKYAVQITSCVKWDALFIHNIHKNKINLESKQLISNIGPSDYFRTCENAW